ncbi:hypothetical protein [Psychrobacter sp. I-STPA10]|uniref:hypothetical protein n=1 Tax=Psychrobacter sp. I-STPA10 TaxID=2585769 RepID=UPI001E651043|nr:hypothetical protein [Psychrobacter sp. I-STPA10]
MQKITRSQLLMAGMILTVSSYTYGGETTGFQINVVDRKYGDSISVTPPNQRRQSYSYSILRNVQWKRLPVNTQVCNTGQRDIKISQSMIGVSNSKNVSIAKGKCINLEEDGIGQWSVGLITRLIETVKAPFSRPTQAQAHRNSNRGGSTTSDDGELDSLTACLGSSSSYQYIQSGHYSSFGIPFKSIPDQYYATLNIYDLSTDNLSQEKNSNSSEVAQNTAKQDVQEPMKQGIETIGQQAEKTLDSALYSLTKKNPIQTVEIKDNFAIFTNIKFDKNKMYSLTISDHLTDNSQKEDMMLIYSMDIKNISKEADNSLNIPNWYQVQEEWKANDSLALPHWYQVQKGEDVDSIEKQKNIIYQIDVFKKDHSILYLNAINQLSMIAANTDDQQNISPPIYSLLHFYQRSYCSDIGQPQQQQTVIEQ